MVDFNDLRDKIIDYGIWLFEEPESSGDLDVDDFLTEKGKPIYEIFVCGPRDCKFYYDEENLNSSPLKEASLENLAIQVSMRINPSIGQQLELSSFYSKMSTNELCAAFLIKFREFGDT